MPPAGSAAIASAAALLVAVVAGGAPGRAVAPPLLTLSPALVAVTAQPGDPLPGMVVANAGAVPLVVEARPALIRQVLEPGVLLRERRPDRVAARRAFAVTPNRFTLAPGARRELHVGVRDFGRRAEVDGAVVVSTVVPGRVTRLRLRLVGVVAVARAGRTARAARIAGVSLHRAGRRTEAWVVVRNPGPVHTTVRGVAVRSRATGGGPATRGDAPGSLLLPGASRRYRVRLGSRPRHGAQRVRITLATDGRPVSRTVVVWLTGEARAPAPEPRRTRIRATPAARASLAE